MPQQGFHLHAGVGPAMLTYQQRYWSSRHYYYYSDYSSTTSGGIGVAAGVGWEGWVGKQWGIGGMLTLHWAYMKDTFDMETYSPTTQSYTRFSESSSIHAVSPTLMFTATYN
jgi:hypothetical protein